MSKRTEKGEVCPIPRALTFRGVREVVMENVWAKADELEQKGIPLTHAQFSRMLRQEWKTAKEELIPKARAEFEACKRRLGLEDVVKEVEAEARLTLRGQVEEAE